jgi:hypothetical protein
MKTDPVSTQTPGVELYLPGSSAEGEALESLIRLPRGVADAPALREPGTLDVYRGLTGGTANRVFYCRAAGNIAGSSTRPGQQPHHVFGRLDDCHEPALIRPAGL